MRSVPFFLSVVTLAAQTFAVSSSPARLLHQFPNEEQWVESITQLDNGLLVVTTLFDGQIYSLDPYRSRPFARLAAQVPGFDRFTGIVRVAPNVVAATGGKVESFYDPFIPDSAAVVLLDFAKAHQNGSVPYRTVARLPEAGFPNGLAPLPEHPHIVLSADSANAAIYRIDTVTGRHDVVLQSNDTLSAGPNPALPLGINGIDVRGDYIYFTNSGRLTYGRIKIDPFGYPVTGEVEILQTVPSQYQPDGLALTRGGEAYLALHPGSVGRVSKEGELGIVDIDTSNTGVLQVTTDVILGRGEKTLFLVTGGNSTAAHTGGQIVQVNLKGRDSW